jgi:hypothetical protein
MTLMQRLSVLVVLALALVVMSLGAMTSSAVGPF